MSESITVLRSAGPRLTKTWRADGSMQAYADALQVLPMEHAVSDLRGLFELLQRLAGDPRSCIVRGRFIGQEPAAQRLAGEPKAQGLRPGHTLRRGAVFEDVPRRWLMLDVDSFRPQQHDPVNNPEGACREFIDSQLPAAFHLAPFVWQLSASAGHPSNAGKLKAHVWLWMTEPRTSAELKAWAATVPGIDSTVFSAVQPHFTAAPVFEDGVSDPVPCRLGFAEGLDDLRLEIDAATLARARDRTGGHAPMADPRDKAGLVGVFCRHYGPADLAELLPSDFEPSSGRDGHFNWLGHANAEGVFVTPCGHGLVSEHNTAPTGQGRRRNVADFTRLHLFAHLDEGQPDTTSPTQLPSYKAWRDWVKAEHPAVWAEHVAELREASASSAENDFGGLDDSEEPESEPDTPPSSPKAGKGRQLKLKRYGDLVNQPPPRWLVRGWMPEVGAGMLYGPSNAGKSLAVLDLALCVARGADWHGIRTLQGGVLYCALEGAWGFRWRLDAYGMHHGIDLRALPFALMDDALDLRTGPVDAGALIELGRGGIEGQAVKLVVIDTFSKAFAGGDENAAADVTRVLRSADRIAAELKCFVLVVHHAGKQEERGARGSSALRCDVDTMIELRRTTVGTELRLDKVKEGPTDLRLGFKLVEVDVGTDADDQPIRSVVAVPTSAPPGGAPSAGARARPARVGAREQLVFNAISQAKGFDDLAPTMDDVLAAAVSLAGEDAPRRDNLNATIRALIAKGTIVDLGGRLDFAAA